MEKVQGTFFEMSIGIVYVASSTSPSSHDKHIYPLLSSPIGTYESVYSFSEL